MCTPDQISITGIYPLGSWTIKAMVHVHCCVSGHSWLVWYSMGACDSPQLGGIEREGGPYIEKVFLGGMSCAEFELEPMCLVEIGIVKKDGLFYPIGESQFLMPATQY